MVITSKFVKVPADSDGKEVDAVEVTTAAIDPAYRQVVAIGGPNVTDGVALAPVSATDGLLVNLGGNNDVTVAGVATAANQLPDGHAVTVDNLGGASAVPIQDGGNSITVDGTVSVAYGSGTFPVSGTITANAGTGTRVITGDVAHDAADSGSPLKVGGKAVVATPTKVAANDRVDAWFDLHGRQIVRQHGPRDRCVHNTITLTTTGETTLLAAGAAGVFRDLVMLIVSNGSDVDQLIEIRDATGGTVRIPIHLATGGGGAVIPFPVPVNQALAANNWTAKVSTAIGSGNVRIFALGVETN